MRNLFQSSRSVIGAKFKLGGQNKAEGLDCLSMTFAFFQEAGINLPREFEGLKYEDYLQIYKRDDWEEIYLRFLRSLGDTVPIEFSLPGDIIVFNGERGISAGINAGNAHVIVIVKDRVMKWPLRITEVIEVIRWVE